MPADGRKDISDMGTGTGQVHHKKTVQYDTANCGVFTCGQGKDFDSGTGVGVSVGR